MEKKEEFPERDYKQELLSLMQNGSKITIRSLLESFPGEPIDGEPTIQTAAFAALDDLRRSDDVRLVTVKGEDGKAETAWRLVSEEEISIDSNKGGKTKYRILQKISSIN